ncbi:MAG: class I adenylate-forming enzyme family protein [Microthrixaceae bacterium]
MTAAVATTFTGPPLEETDGIGALTLPGFLAEVVGRSGTSEAVVLDDPLRDGATVRWSYDDLGREARRIGRALVAAGIGPGRTVAILMGNRPEALAAIFGATLAGAVAAPVSTFAPRPELGALLEACSADVVLTQHRLLARHPDEDVATVAEDLVRAGRVVSLGTDGWDTFLAAGEADGGAHHDLDAVLDRRAAELTPDDPALVILSSGTTAAPKAVLHAHRSPSLQFWVQARLFGRHPGTRMFSALPIFWTAGLNTAVGSTLAAGGCWVAQETFEAGSALALIERERVTEPYTLPHQTAAMAEHPDWASTDLSSVRCAFGKGAYARHPSVRPDPHWIMPVGYGLSETCAFVAGYGSDDSREQVKVGHGRLLPGTRLRVVDPDSGRVLGPGEEGELVVAGSTLMLGYLGRDPLSCVDGDGFFHTGDAGHVDDDGIVHYTGRRTEMIKTGGANVSPAEIEVALRAFPPVKLSRVLGVPDERLDQLVVACIVCREGMAATEEEVTAFLRERVAAYKVPKRVLFLAEDEVPMTAGDTKVRDEELRPIVLERLGLADGRAGTAPTPTTTGSMQPERETT